jgi:hypothetical protein
LSEKLKYGVNAIFHAKIAGAQRIRKINIGLRRIAALFKIDCNRYANENEVRKIKYQLINC